MRDQISNIMYRSRSALARDYPDPYSLRSMAALAAAGAVVCVASSFVPNDGAVRDTAVVSSPCTDLETIVASVEPDSTIAVRNVGDTCVNVYDPNTGKNVGALAVNETAHVVCLEPNAPFGVSVIMPLQTGNTGLATAVISGQQAYTALTNLRGSIPDCVR